MPSRRWRARRSFKDTLNGVSKPFRASDRLHGSHQAVRYQWRRFLGRELCDDFENPTGLTNFLSMYLLLSIPVALTYTFGKMVGSVRHGVALLSVMVILFGVWVGFTSAAEHQNNPAVAAAGIHSTVGNTEGKEVRFGDTTTALFGISSTSTSTGSADGAYDSFTPMGGFGLLHGMML